MEFHLRFINRFRIRTVQVLAGRAHRAASSVRPIAFLPFLRNQEVLNNCKDPNELRQKSFIQLGQWLYGFHELSDSRKGTMGRGVSAIKRVNMSFYNLVI